MSGPHVSIDQVPEARRFADVLRGLVKRKRFREKGRYGSLSRAWDQVIREVLDEENGARTHVAAFEHGRVIVDVDCPILLQELGGFLQSHLLAALRRTPGGEDVADLRFRMRGRSGK